MTDAEAVEYQKELMSAIEDLKHYIAKELKDHKTKDHYPISNDDIRLRILEHNEMRDTMGDTNEIVGRMAIMIEGEPVEDLEGNVIRYKGGMYEDLATLKTKSENGGLRAHVKMSKSQVFIVLGFGTALAYLVVEVLRFSNG